MRPGPETSFQVIGLFPGPKCIKEFYPVQRKRGAPDHWLKSVWNRSRTVFWYLARLPIKLRVFLDQRGDRNRKQSVRNVGNVKLCIIIGGKVKENQGSNVFMYIFFVINMKW